MKLSFPSEAFSDTHTKIFFPEVILTVLNSRVSDICQAHAALSKVFDTKKLGEALSILADTYYEY